MNTVGSFVETLASLVSGLSFAQHLRPKRPLNDVADDRARVTVRSRRLAGSVSDLNDCGLQVGTIQVGQSMGKSDSSLFGGLLSRCIASDLRNCCMVGRDGHPYNKSASFVRVRRGIMAALRLSRVGPVLLSCKYNPSVLSVLRKKDLRMPSSSTRTVSRNLHHVLHEDDILDGQDCESKITSTLRELNKLRVLGHELGRGAEIESKQTLLIDHTRCLIQISFGDNHSSRRTA